MLAIKALTRPLWQHPWLTLMTLMGLALGSAVILAIELINGSARLSVAEAQRQLAGRTTHRIVSPSGWLDEQTFVALLMRFPELHASPVIRADVTTDRGCRLQLLALDPLREGPFGRLRPTGGDGALDLFSAPAGAIDRSARRQCNLALNDSLQFADMTVAIRATLSPAPRPMLVMDIGWGQQLVQRSGQLSQIDLILNEAQARQLRQWLPAPLELTRVASELDSGGVSRSLELNLFALGLLALVIGLFLVYNASHLLLLQRWPLLSQLHALGVGAPQLVGWLVAEMLAIGLVAITLGGGLGWLAASALLEVAGSSYSDHYGLPPLTRVSPDWPVLAPLLGICLSGALFANLPGWLRLWRAAPRPGQPPSTDGFSRRAHGRRLLRLTPALLLALCLPLGLKTTGVIGGLISVAALLLLTALLAPWLLSWMSQGLRRLVRRHWLPRLALGEGERALNRTGVAVSALTLAIAANIGIGIMIHSFRLSVDLWAQQRLAADYYLRGAELHGGQRQPIDDDALTQLQQQPQIAALARRASHSILFEGKPISLVGMELPVQIKGGYHLQEGRFPQRATELLASESFMLLNRRQLGDRLTLVLANRPVTLTIIGIYRDYGAQNGQLMLDWPAWTHWQPGSPPQSVALFMAANPAAANMAPPLPSRQDVRRLLQRWPALANVELASAGQIRQLVLTVFDRTFVITESLQWLTLGIAALGVVFAFTALSMARHPELTLLHGLGLSEREMRWLLVIQIGWPALLAGLLAIPTGLWLAWLLTDVITPRSFGWRMLYQVPWQTPLRAVLTALLAGQLATVVVAWSRRIPR